MQSAIYVKLKNNAVNLSIVMLGLCAAFAFGALVAAFVGDETSYDNWVASHERIYRLETSVLIPGEEPIVTVTSHGPVVGLLSEETRLFEKLTRHYVAQSRIRTGARSEPVDISFTDPAYISMFGVELIDGTVPELGPSTIIVSQSYLSKLGLSGSDKAIGQILIVNEEPLTLTGVFRDFPDQSHYRPQLITDHASKAFPGGVAPIEGWDTLEALVYGLATPSAQVKGLSHINAEIAGVLAASGPPSPLPNGSPLYRINAKPLEDLYLSQGGLGRVGPEGDRNLVSALTVSAIFLLLAATFNFMSFMVVSSINRTREIAIRRSTGASRGSVFSIFVRNALLLSSTSFFIGLGLAIMLSDSFAELIVRPTLEFGNHIPSILIAGLALVVTMSFISAAYPVGQSFSRSPAAALQGRISVGNQGRLIWNSLTVFQLALSILLASIALSEWSRANDLRNTDTGYSSENIYFADISGTQIDADSKQNALRRLTASNIVSNAALASDLPGLGNVKMAREVRAQAMQEPSLMSVIAISPGYFETLEIEKLSGRFPRNTNNDFRDSIVINEAARDALGFDTPETAIGATLEMNGVPFNILSVFKSARLDGPLNMPQATLFVFEPDMANLVLWKSAPGHEVETSLVRDVIGRLSPDIRLEPQSLDNQLAKTFLPFEKRVALYIAGTILLLLVTLMGVYNLVLLIIAARYREIGIRLSIGASASNVAALVMKPLVHILAISTVLAALAFFILPQVSGSLSDIIIRSYAWTLIVSALLVAAVTFGVALFCIMVSLRKETSDLLNA